MGTRELLEEVHGSSTWPPPERVPELKISDPDRALHTVQPSTAESILEVSGLL